MSFENSATARSAADPQRHDGTSQVLAGCIEAALKSQAESWTCTPAGLTVAGNSGKQSFTPISPGVAPSVESGGVTALDDYDSWCEFGSVCHREINDYAAETKGNAAYGNQNGVIGTFDVVMRINLNGRQAQTKITLIWDSGPAIQFNEVWGNCWEEINNWPDTNCGNHYAGAPVIGPVGWRWNSGTLYGNRLDNSNEYYMAVSGRFTPSGHPLYVMGVLESLYFHCYGSLNDRCYFPY
ncbi:hypothetical protein LFM09_01455 [Lentzea alba]|uniref:hypothetical protein n=1 Tax=Lentzea alba TaxID=2714351 RepID=UPI0039BF3018